VVDVVSKTHLPTVRRGPVQGGNGRVRPKGAGETCSPREWSVPNVRSGNMLPEVLWRRRIRREDEEGGASSRRRLRVSETRRTERGYASCISYSLGECYIHKSGGYLSSGIPRRAGGR
jgi:hypothetical protein